MPRRSLSKLLGPLAAETHVLSLSLKNQFLNEVLQHFACAVFRQVVNEFRNANGLITTELGRPRLGVACHSFFVFLKPFVRLSNKP